MADNCPYMGPDNELETASYNPPNNHHGLPSLTKTCFIQPKSTGLASLFLQFGLLIVSGLTSMFFFYHVGGYEYMEWNENSTILQPVHHQQSDIPANQVDVMMPAFLLTTLAPVLTEKDIQPVDGVVKTDSRKTRSSDNSTIEIPLNETIEAHIDDSDQGSLTSFIDNLLTGEDDHDDDEDDFDLNDNSTFGIEQVPMTTVEILGIKFDWLEVIRISTLVYLAICIGWFITMVLFICTIRFEILDTTIANLVILIIIVLYLFVHSALIVALLFFQTEMSWRTMAITIGSIVILSCSAILGCVCVSLNFGWVRYIDYMHVNRKCLCIAGIVRLIKGRKHSSNPNNYEMSPNNANNLNNFDNEVPIQQFSAF